jgi:hypothetical protein
MDSRGAGGDFGCSGSRLRFTEEVFIISLLIFLNERNEHNLLCVPKLDLVHTDTGEPFVSVTAPRITLAGPMMASPSWEAAATIIRAERGWIVHNPEDGPLYEFATPQEVAVFLAGRGVHTF